MAEDALYRFKIADLGDTPGDRAIRGLDWQPIDDLPRSGDPMMVRNGEEYQFAYFGLNDADSGFPARDDDDHPMWRSAQDSSLGQPIEFLPTEGAVPADDMFERFGSL